MDIKAELKAFCDTSKDIGSKPVSKMKAIGSLASMLGHIEPESTPIPEDVFSGLDNDSRRIILLSFLTVSMQIITGNLK